MHFYNACLHGDITMVKALADKGYAFNWLTAFVSAYQGGCIKIVKFIVTKAKKCKKPIKKDEWNSALKFACFSGNLDLIHFAIANGACDWDVGLTQACEGGHLEIVKLMISKGANYWDLAFYGACISGNLDIMQLIISKLNSEERLLSQGFDIASSHGHMKVVQFLSSKGYPTYLTIEYACRSGNMKLVHFMIGRGASDWNYGLGAACLHGHIDIAEFMISKGANMWVFGFDSACAGGHMNAVKLMISKGANNWISGFEHACGNGQLKVMKFIISKLEQNKEWTGNRQTSQTNGATGQTNDRWVDLWTRGFKSAFHSESNYECVDNVIVFLISKGANIKEYYSWPLDETQIVKLLHLGAPLEKFQHISGYTTLKAKVDGLKNTIVGQNVLLPDLMLIIYRCIIYNIVDKTAKILAKSF